MALEDVVSPAPRSWACTCKIQFDYVLSRWRWQVAVYPSWDGRRPVPGSDPLDVRRGLHSYLFRAVASTVWAWVTAGPAESPHSHRGEP